VPRLTLLSTTHRVPAGLLSYPAWSALAQATEVYAASADHPLALALDAAGVVLRVPDAAAGADAPTLATWLLGRAEAVAGDVVWLLGLDGDPGLTDALAQLLATAAESGRSGPEVELVAGSWDLPGARLLDLVAVMDRLRSPGGCPWDAQQTHRSLLPYLLEEAYETVEAVETDDLDGLREELGDLLLQVVFHARLGEEHPDHPWSVDDVAAGIVEKLVARHPHVFARRSDGEPSAEQVDQRWDELKRAEKGRRSAVDGVPLDQPALALAAKLLSRAERAGVDVAVPPVPAATDPAPTDESVGAALLALVATASAAGVDPEAALRAVARRLAAQVRQRESEASAG
jgi:XTP/dITP diphosphohydrolase